MHQGSNSKIANFLMRMDWQPYTIQLNYKNKRHIKSKTGGVISLAFILASLTILCINIVNLFISNQIICETFVLKNTFYQPINLTNSNFGLLITGHNGSDYFNITRNNIGNYGLEVFVQSTYQINGTSKNARKAQPCSIYNNTKFNQEYFCFPMDYSMILYGRSDIELPFTDKDKDKYRRIGIFVKNTQDINPNYTLQNFTVKLRFLNIMIQMKNLTFTNQQKIRTFYIKDGLPISRKQLQQLQLYFQRVEVTTDRNWVWSQGVQKQNYSHFNQQYLTMSTSNQDLKSDDYKDKLVWIKLKRSINSMQYNRYQKKLPQAMAESFGLIGAISLVFILYKGYNRWKFFNEDLREQGNNNKSNILSYYCSKIRNYKDKRWIQQTVEQFEHELDIYTIRQKLNQIQQRLKIMQIQKDKQESNQIKVVRSSMEWSDKHNKQQLQQPLIQNKRI